MAVMVTKSTPKPPIKVQVLRRFDTSAERIFDAFLDPVQAGKFMFATPTGKMIRAHVEPRVGGAFVFIDQRPNGNAEHYGTFTELTRPRRLAFRFAVEKDAKESDLVTIDIVPRDRRCEVVLTHEMNAKFSEFKDRVAEGWTSILSGLAATILSN
ncbi:MAG: SRPBCC domain-containing protein [Deltaproteobacteria bacterium]|nr:SRPBCC domain-containing protein [Deltaproteobacteria bacterium]